MKRLRVGIFPDDRGLSSVRNKKPREEGHESEGGRMREDDKI